MQALTKTGAGVLNLSGPYSAFGGTLTINGGIANLLPGFSNLTPTRTSLVVNNPNTGPGSDVTLNIQTTTTFRALFGTIATPSSGINTAAVNLVGVGTQVVFDSSAGF